MLASDWEKRVDHAWATCSDWWGSDLEQDDAAQLRFSGLTQERVARAFGELKERSLWHREGALWTPESFDEDCVGTEESLQRVAAGALAALTLHYRPKETRGLPLELFTTVTWERPEGLRVTVLAVWRLVGNDENDLETRFRALLEHARELMVMLDARELELAPKVRGELSRRDGWLQFFG